jgi:predicted RNase H-like HicB family nuclease
MTTGEQQLHYSMVIEWDPRDGGVFVVSFPEWHETGDIALTHGASSEAAAATGHDVLDFLILSAQEEDEPLPPPRTFASTSPTSQAGGQ